MPYADPNIRRQKQRDYYRRNRGKMITAASGWAAENPEKRREITRRYRECNPGQAQRYYRDHADEAKRRATAWAKANPEARRAAQRRYQAQDAARAARADRQLAREARKRDQFVEEVDRCILLALHEGHCGVCGDVVDPAAFHVDHRVPLCRGGEHSYANTQPAHPTCNLRKGGQ